MFENEDLGQLGKDLAKGTFKAINETIQDRGVVDSLNAAGACFLCVNLLKHNAIPIATALVCAGCGIFISVPVYKSVKQAIETPFKGFID